jgi:hypothetical protein
MAKKPPTPLAPESSSESKSTPAPTASSEKSSKSPLVFPPNFRDVTHEHAGTVFAIIGAEHLRKGKP